MDRAHRLGQQRTVNVYRVLIKGTLEERIMSLQAFKLDVANTVVSQDNASMTAMDTTRLLDLLSSHGGVSVELEDEALPLCLLSVRYGHQRCAAHVAWAACVHMLFCIGHSCQRAPRHGRGFPYYQGMLLANFKLSLCRQSLTTSSI